MLLREFADKVEAAIKARDFRDDWGPMDVQQSCSEMIHEQLDEFIQSLLASQPSMFKQRMAMRKEFEVWWPCHSEWTEPKQLALEAWNMAQEAHMRVDVPSMGTSKFVVSHEPLNKSETQWLAQSTAALQREPLCGICGMNQAYHDPEIVDHKFRIALASSSAPKEPWFRPFASCDWCGRTTHDARNFGKKCSNIGGFMREACRGTFRLNPIFDKGEAGK